mgnify:CR=1 FL=1
MLREKVDTALKTAMKARTEPTRVSTLRLINAAIKDRDIAARSEDRCEGVSDDEILAILTKMVKQREDSSVAFDKGGRPELAEQERAEIEVIREFLPRQLSEAEIGKEITQFYAQLIDSPDKTYQQYLDQLTQESCHITAELHNHTTTQQRQKAVERLQQYIDDLSNVKKPATY